MIPSIIKSDGPLEPGRIMARVTSTLLIVIGLSFFIPSCVFGQTSRYWSLNFASEPSILAGAVVGGYAENQAVYYNPAVIYENLNDNVSFSGEIISLDLYRARNAFGQGLDYRATQIEVIPSYFSFFVQSKKDPRLSFQVALITRDKNDYDVTESFMGNQDLLPGVQGIERFSSFYESTIRYIEIWGGGGASYRLNENWSVGMSLFLCGKKLDDKATRSINILPETNMPSQGDSVFQYLNAREVSRAGILSFHLQSKFGIQYRSGPWSLGLNLNPSSIYFLGWGKRYREVGVNNLYNVQGNNRSDDLSYIGTGKDLPARIKDPFSVAVGVNYTDQKGKQMIGLAIHYFHQIPIYSMIDIEGSSIVTTTPLTDPGSQLKVWSGARSLVNLAVGYRKTISEELTLISGFRTDLDYLKGVDFSRTSNANNQFVRYFSDVYHLTLGARFKLYEHRFIIGTQLSYGREPGQKQVASFIPEVNPNGPTLPVENLRSTPVDYSYGSVALFFGFIFNFKDKVINQ